MTIIILSILFLLSLILIYVQCVVWNLDRKVQEIELKVYALSVKTKKGTISPEENVEI